MIHFVETLVGRFEIDRNYSSSFEECGVTIEIEKERKKDKMKLPVDIGEKAEVENGRAEWDS